MKNLAKPLPRLEYDGRPLIQAASHTVESMIGDRKTYTLGGNGRPDKAWQIPAFEALHDRMLFVLKAVPGAGKSFLVDCLCMDKIFRSNFKRKALIVVPQTQIVDSFLEPMRNNIDINGTKYPPLALDQDFCGDSIDKMEKLRTFLITPVEDLVPQRHELFDSTIAFATHHNLVHIWFGIKVKPLSAEEKRIAAKNMIFIFDECHHISHDENSNEDMTWLGRLLDEVLSMKEPTCDIGMATATFIRNDKRSIIPESRQKEFFKYSLPWDEYFRTLGIDEFIFDYIPYRDSPRKAIIKNVRREPDKFHLIILPKTGDGFRNIGTLAQILKSLAAVVPKETILDMVTPRTQEKNFARLRKNVEQFHVVIACDKFNEGTDWPPCSRVHNLAYSRDPSIPRLHQINGRAYRAYPGKTSVAIYNYIDSPRDPDLRTMLSDHFNAIMVSLMIDEMFNPILLPVLPRPNRPRVTLEEFFADEDRYMQYKASVVLGMSRLTPSERRDSDKRQAVCYSIAREYWDAEMGAEIGLTLDQFSTATYTLACRIKAVRTRGIKKLVPEFPMDLSLIREQLDAIWEKEVEGDLIFGTNLPPDIFDEVRKILEEMKGKLGVNNWSVTDTQEDANNYELFMRAMRSGGSTPRIPSKTADKAPRDLVGTEVKTPQGLGRVISQDKKDCVVRIYKKAVKGESSLYIKEKGVMHAYARHHSAWIRKTFLTTTKMPAVVRSGMITDQHLLRAKKAVDMGMPVEHCTPII